MSIYYITMQVIPTDNNLRINEIEGAQAICWIRDDNSMAALGKACLMVRQYDWEIIKIENYPALTTRYDFIGKDIGLSQYDIAQKDGIAMTFLAWSKDGKSSYGPCKLKRSIKLSLDSFLTDIKSLKHKGRCLHFDAGHRCTEVINAHSIQKKISLLQIAENGKVYSISKNFGDIRRNKGRLSYTKQGISQISTFRGFCEKHDNELFEPIDNYKLIPTNQQILLYAYRSLCREIFEKEINVHIHERLAEECKKQKEINTFHDNTLKAAQFGLDNLMNEKKHYDNDLKTKSYSDIKYVLYCSRNEPTIAFSGLFYPDYDFLGYRLQDLGDHKSLLDLITFSSAPMNDGWGYLFAWHSRSSKACIAFMRSLATVVHEKGSLEDCLFRLVVSNCENMAISPKWWKSLPENDKNRMSETISNQADIFQPIMSDYLSKGLEGISGWEFDGVISDMD